MTLYTRNSIQSFAQRRGPLFLGGRMHRFLYIIFLPFFITSCSYVDTTNTIVAIQIQDRNGLTETISAPERLKNYDETDFLAPQPYKKVLRIYRNQGKNQSKITTYHPNGLAWQYLEAEELRAFGIYKEWHPNGQLHIEAHVIGGTADVSSNAQKDWLFHGVSHVWNEQGFLIAKIPYKQGMLEGVSTYFYASGEIEKELPYRGHILEGIAIEYYPDHQIHSKTTYVQGEKTGPSVGYFKNQQLAWTEEYRDNLLINGAYYSPGAEIISTVESGSGLRALFDGEYLSYLVQVQQGFIEGKVKQFTRQGDLVSSYFVKNGKKTGTETVYFLPHEIEGTEAKDLQPKITVNWEDHTIHGSVKTWYSTGQMQSQKDFCHNKKTGPSMSWYRNGSLMLVEEYEEDRLVKGNYYKKNALDAISSVTNGNGLVTLYDENGVFLRKIPYLKGEPVDPSE